LAQFPGRISIPFVEAGAAIGLAKQTCYNLRARGKFPLRVHMEGDRPMVALTVLIQYLEIRTKTSAANQPNVGPMPAVKRGRPSARDRERAAEAA